MLGQSDITGVAFYTGDPSLAAVGSFNVVKGTLVIDTVNGALYQKTGVLGVNTAGYNQILGSPAGTKIYRALLTQAGTAAPVATVLENTLGGTVVWTRIGAGSYVGTLTGAFSTTKTIGSVSAGFMFFTTTNANAVNLTTADDAGSAIDDALAGSSLSITVYP